MTTFTIKEQATGIVAGNSWDIFTSFSLLAQADQACLWVLGYNADNIEIKRECVQKSGKKDLNADVSLVLRRVLASGATAWACVYNHTSGVCRPKENDINFAYSMFAVSDLVALTFFVCIIIADDGYFSFRDQEYFVLFEECGGIDLQRIERRPVIDGPGRCKIVNIRSGFKDVAREVCYE